MTTLHKFTCCICKKQITNEWGNNPYPVSNKGKCCEYCNRTIVLPARIKNLMNNQKSNF